MIERQVGIPYWETIRDELVRRIESGEYGARTLVVERRLAEEFGTTRITVRKAMEWLRGNRYIETRTGIGSRVVYRRPEEGE